MKSVFRSTVFFFLKLKHCWPHANHSLFYIANVQRAFIHYFLQFRPSQTGHAMQRTQTLHSRRIPLARRKFRSNSLFSRNATFWTDCLELLTEKTPHGLVFSLHRVPQCPIYFGPLLCLPLYLGPRHPLCHPFKQARQARCLPLYLLLWKCSGKVQFSNISFLTVF